MIAAADLSKLEPVAWAKACTLAIQVPTMSAIKTAYSTVVGPSSLISNLSVLCQIFTTLKTPTTNTEFTRWTEPLNKPRMFLRLRRYVSSAKQ